MASLQGLTLLDNWLSREWHDVVQVQVPQQKQNAAVFFYLVFMDTNLQSLQIIDYSTLKK